MPLCRFRTDLDEFESKLRIAWMHSPGTSAAAALWQSHQYILTRTTAAGPAASGHFASGCERTGTTSIPCPSTFATAWNPIRLPLQLAAERRQARRTLEVLRSAENRRRVQAARSDRDGALVLERSFSASHAPQSPISAASRSRSRPPPNARKRGVNVSLFISVAVLANPMAARYGLGLGELDHHPEFLPRIGLF